MPSIDELLQKWIEIGLSESPKASYYQKHRFYGSSIRPKKAYDTAITLLQNELKGVQVYTPQDVKNFFAQDLKKRVYAPRFRDYGIFISALTNYMVEPGKTIILPTKEIVEPNLDKDHILLNYLGFRFGESPNARELIKANLIIDGDFGYAGGSRMKDGFAVFNGNGTDETGAWQEAGDICVLGRKGVRHAANYKQKGGRLIILYGAKNRIDEQKTGGETYVLENGIGDKGGLKMKAGRLAVFGPGGKDTAKHQFGGEIMIGGKAEVGERFGGELQTGKMMIFAMEYPEAHELVFYKCKDLLKQEGIV